MPIDQRWVMLNVTSSTESVIIWMESNNVIIQIKAVEILGAVGFLICLKYLKVGILENVSDLSFDAHRRERFEGASSRVFCCFMLILC